MSQFFNDFLEWVLISGITDELLPIFSKAECVSRNKSRVTIKQLTNSELLVAMRATAEINGIPGYCFTTKSGRIGAVTNSSKSGRSSEQIRAVTGHATDSSMRLYDRADSIHTSSAGASLHQHESVSGQSRVNKSYGANLFMDAPAISVSDLKRSLSQSTVTRVAHGRSKAVDVSGAKASKGGLGIQHPADQR